MDAKELLLAAESVRNILVARACNATVDNEEYQRQRELLVANVHIGTKLPRFVVTCRTLDEFWGFIQPTFPKHRERREFLRNEFAPLLSMLESSVSAPRDSRNADTKQAVLNIVADLLVLKNQRVVRGLDLRQDLPKVEGTTKRQLVLSLVPELLRMEGTSDEDSYALMPKGALQSRHSATIRNLAVNLRALLVDKHRQDREFDGISWAEVKPRIQHDGRELTDDDFELVNFVLLCLGVWGGGGARANYRWTRPRGSNLEMLLEPGDTDEIFQRVQEELVRQSVPAVAPVVHAVSGLRQRQREETAARLPPDTRTHEMRTETKNILFMDLAGWSKLKAPQIGAYVQQGLPKLDALAKARGAQHVNTWGDALVATFGSTKEAANCALDVRDFFRRAAEGDGVPSGLIPRIALHVGEVIIAFNPLLQRLDIFGAAVHVAARLEPMASKGEVCCTRQFASALAEVDGLGPTAHSLGKVQLPKDFGVIDIFAVVGPNESPPPPMPESRQPASDKTNLPAVATGPGELGSDESARVRMKGWLNKLPRSRSGDAIPLQEIVDTCRVSPGQPFRLLPEIVEKHRFWEIDDLTEDDVILKYRREPGFIVA